MDYHEWTTEMDYLNGQLNGLPKWTTLNYLPWKKNDNQSLVVLIDGPLPSPLRFYFSFFMLLVSCSTDAFIRPVWWQIPWVTSKNLALRSRRRLVKIWILMIVSICLMSKFLTRSTCKLETKSFADTVFTVIDQNNQALVTLAVSFSFFQGR